MTAAASTSDWMVAEGWREGLFAKCVDELAPLPLPFDMPEEEGCSKARAVSKYTLNFNNTNSDIRIWTCFEGIMSAKLNDLC